MRFLTCEPTSMWSLQLKNPWFFTEKVDPFPENPHFLLRKNLRFFVASSSSHPSRGATQPLDTWPGPACADGVRCTAPPPSAAPAADRPGRQGDGRGRGASGRGREAHRWGPWKSSDLAPAGELDGIFCEFLVRCFWEWWDLMGTFYENGNVKGFDRRIQALWSHDIPWWCNNQEPLLYSHENPVIYPLYSLYKGNAMGISWDSGLLKSPHAHAIHIIRIQH